MIELKNITKQFINGKLKTNALNGINLEINKGDFICITGDSGSGKTTLLHILGLIEKPTSGEILFNGKKVNEFSSRMITYYRKNNIGIVFQNFSLIPNLTCYENVLYPLLFSSVPYKKRKEIVKKILFDLKIEKLKNHFPSELSGGEKQRVGIARAIVHSPTLVIADEPTANLDSKNSQNIIELLKKISKEKNITVIVASHDDTVINKSETIYKLKDGRISNE